MANSDDSRGGASKRGIDKNGTQEIKERQNIAQFGLGRCSTDVAYANSGRQQECHTNERRLSVFGQISAREFYDQWETEPDVGRVADGISNRVDRLRGLGNAVVPQVAEYIGRLVMAAELNNS